MRNLDFNKFYDFDKGLESAIFNIVGVQFCNIPRRRNSTNCGFITNRSSITLEVLSKNPTFIYKKDEDIYWSFDEQYQVFNAYSTKKPHFESVCFDRTLDVHGGRVFKSKGVTRNKKIKLYNIDFRHIAFEKLGINIIDIGVRLRGESFAYQTHFSFNREVIERKLLQAGLNIMDFENSLLGDEK